MATTLALAWYVPMTILAVRDPLVRSVVAEMVHDGAVVVVHTMRRGVAATCRAVYAYAFPDDT